MPDYGAIISKTFKTIKKSKWLFVYGLVLAAFASGGSYSNINTLSQSGGDIQNLPESIPQDIPEKTSQVLGSFTTSITQWLQSISPFVWILLALAVIAAIIFGICVRWVIAAWAKGSLIGGFDKSLNGENVGLKNTSPIGMSSIKNLVIFAIIMFLISLSIFITLPLIWVIIYLVVKSVEILGILWIIAGVIVGFITFIGAILLLSMVTVYAERLIVLKKYSPWEAWKKGLSLSRGSFLPTLVMGIINSVLGAAVGCVFMIVALIVLGIPTGVLLVPSIISKQFPSPVVIIMLVILFFVFIYTNLVVAAFVILLKYGNWNQMFDHTYKKVEGGKKDG